MEPIVNYTGNLPWSVVLTTQGDRVMMDTGQRSTASCAQGACVSGISPVAGSPFFRYRSMILLIPSFGSSSNISGQVLQHVVQLVQSERLIVTVGILLFTSLRIYLNCPSSFWILFFSLSAESHRFFVASRNTPEVISMTLHQLEDQLNRKYPEDYPKTGLDVHA